jgi:hypothetical protein
MCDNAKDSKVNSILSISKLNYFQKDVIFNHEFWYAITEDIFDEKIT